MTRTRFIAPLSLLIGTALTAPALAAANPFAIAPDLVPAASATGPAAAVLADPSLRRFPATPGELSFNGENPYGQFPIFVTATETGSAAKLILSYRSAVSIAPESSQLRVLVNETVVSETRLGIGDARQLAVDLPTGLLQPGFNAVRIEVKQRHRVDCSLSGTYELWTRIDPAASGLHFANAYPALGDLGEIAALQPDDGGRIRLHAQVVDGATPDDLKRALSGLQSLSLLGHFQSPIVSLGASADDGNGLDLFVGTSSTLSRLPAEWLSGNTEIPYVNFVPGAPGRRTKLIVSGPTAAEVDTALAALARQAEDAKPLGSVAGLEVLAQQRGRSVAGGETVSLADLGMRGEQFTGRFFRDEASVSLPSDFYAADYGYAAVVLDAAYAGGLKRDAQLIVRANGAIVSTLSLSSSRSGRLDKQHLRLPLSALKPGPNTISVEALLPAPSDAACEPMAQIDPPVRFALAGSSSLVMPRLARIGHYPDLSAMASGVAHLAPEPQALSILVPQLEETSLNAAGTLVAKMAVASGQVRETRVLSSMPHEETGDLLAVGPRASMPAELLRAVRMSSDDANIDLTESRAPGWTSIEAHASEGAAMFDAMNNASTDAMQALASVPNVIERVSDVVTPYVSPILAAVGKPATAAKAHTVRDDGLVMAQGRAPFAPAAAWTVVSAPTSAMLERGVDRLTSGRTWSALGGAMTQVADADGALDVTPAAGEALFQTQPRSIGNERLIIAGWFSRHVQEYVMMLIGISALLGLMTFLFLRHVGVRTK